ncbi:MAG: FeoA family protein [Bacillota bacterium]|nr:FeoA family protein [Bacillota bacterium]
MTLNEAQIGVPYIIKGIRTDNCDLNSFLQRLGCYSGQSVTVISRKRKGCIASIMNNRYSFDESIAEAILI